MSRADGGKSESWSGWLFGIWVALLVVAAAVLKVADVLAEIRDLLKSR